MPVKMADFTGRIKFGDFLNKKSLHNAAVEVGTNRGVFADALLHRWKRGRLFCVDPWVGGYDNGDPASHGDREADYKIACETLAKYGPRCKILREYSVQAAKRFKAESLSFVYVDACHQAEAVKEDIETWWPKVHSGGLLAGHDIYSSRRPGEGWDKFIRPVVTEFANAQGVTVFLVPELPGYNWSYYLVKP